MSSDFITPGRASSGRSDGSSSNRRVMRSALETLLETKSPDLHLSGSAEERSRPPPSPQPPPLRREGDMEERAPKETTRTAPLPTAPPRGFTVSYAGHGGKRAASLPASGGTAEEPSALLFLSPSDTASRPSALAKAKAKRITDARHPATAGEPSTFSARARSEPPPPPPAPSPDPSRSLLAEVEQAEEQMEARRRGAAPAVASPPPPATEAAIEARIAAALAAYERQRDEEETAVLKQIDKEIGEKERVNRELLAEKDEVMQLAKSLQAQLTAVVEQCEELQGQNRDAAEEQQRLRDALARAEVELCHTQDALRLQQRQSGQHTGAAAALEEQLAARTAEVAAKDAALAELQRQYVAECEDIKEKMLSLGQSMAEMESTLLEKDRVIAQLQRKLEDVQKGKSATTTATQRENEALTLRVAELQELLQAQTDEVRRRMTKVGALEAEKKTLRQQLGALAEAVRLTAEKEAALQSSLEVLAARLKAEMRGVMARAKAISASPAAASRVSLSPSPPRQDALDHTHPFDSEDDAGEGASISGASWGSMSEGEQRGEDGTEAAVNEKRPKRSAARSGGSATRLAKQLFHSEGGKASKKARRSVAAASHVSALTAAETEVAQKALRQSCAGCMRVARDLSITAELLFRRLRRQLSSSEKALEAQAAARNRAEDLAQRLETACRYLKTKLSASEKEVDDTKEEGRAMAKDLELLEAEADRTTAEKQALEARVEALEDARKEAADAKKALEQEVLKLFEQLRAATAASHALEEEKSALERKLSDAVTAAAAVPGLAEDKLSLEQALAKEAAAVARLTERLKHVEEDRAKAAADRAALEDKHNAVVAQLEASRTQQAAKRGKDARDAQHAAAEVKRLTHTLETVKAECADLRVQLAKEKATHEDAATATEEKMAALVEAVRTYRGQLTELAREMELRRSGEHATLQAILDATHTVTAAHAAGDSDADSSIETAEEESGAAQAAVGAVTPAKADGARASSTARDGCSLSPLPGGVDKSLGSTPGGRTPGAAAVRVALLTDSLSAAKARRKRRGSTRGGGGGGPASAATGRRKSTALLRREAVQAVREATLELARLQEEARQQQPPRHDPRSVRADAFAPALTDSFPRMERWAREAAQRSAQRRDPHLRFAETTRSPLPSAKLFTGSTVDDWDDAAGTGAGGEPCFDDPFATGGAASPHALPVARRHSFPYRGSPSALSSSPSPVMPSRGDPRRGSQPPLRHSPGTHLFHAAIPTLAIFGGGSATGGWVAQHATPSTLAAGKRASLSLSATPPTMGPASSGLSSSPPGPRSSSSPAGDVDGSCAPARPPALRAAAVPS